MARFKKGDYKVSCDLSGGIVNAYDCKMMWNGLFVLKNLWSKRQPQDILVSTETTRIPQNPRPGGVDVFIDSTDVKPGDL